MAWGRVNTGGGAAGGLPSFTYSGTYMLIDDGDKNWRIKFLTSGTLVMEESISVDAFLVGGGAGGDTGNAYNSPYSGRGGGAGYTKTTSGIVLTTEPYIVQIGAGGRGHVYNVSSATNGGSTIAFSVTCGGGLSNGNGGSGGLPENSSQGGHNAGVDGGNGTKGDIITYGQGTTTREFGEAAGDLYAGGGGGVWRYGGDGGGGRSADGNLRSIYGYNGATNYGGGGAGNNNSYTGGDGGSGIVVIRNHREAAA